MAIPLTLRNLTTQPLTLKLVERYEAAYSTLQSDSTISSLFGRPTGSVKRVPSSTELSRKAQTFHRQEVDIRLEPFRTYKIDLETTKRGPEEKLRLTLHDDEFGRWRIDVPIPPSAPRRLTPLVSNLGRDLTCTYLSDASTLAMMEFNNPHCWMKDFRDETPLSALSIPGTHNAPTCYRALPSVRCQAVGILEQLKNGIRFLDIRVQPASANDATDETLMLVHGAFPVSLTGSKRFRSLVDEVRGFLDENPTETVLMSLKREGIGNATDQQLSTILHDHYADTKWYTEPRVPSLGEVRGKIILMRRFALDDRLKCQWHGRGWGLNAEAWTHNTADCIHGDVRVQDFCEVLETVNIDKKISLCCDHFERASQIVSPIPYSISNIATSVPCSPLYLNFLSGSNFWRMGCWPERIAMKVNPAIIAFLCTKHSIDDRGVEQPGTEVQGGGLGIVVCDWVGKEGDWDLVRVILAMNNQLFLRQSKH